MSVHKKDGRWVVRWRSDGRQRSRAFRLRRDAEQFDRDRRLDTWRDSVAAVPETVSASIADRRNTFVVSERLPSGIAQRPIHEGYFTMIQRAEQYRRLMPDAADLAIVLLRNRYPSRDLTDPEIAAGKVDEMIPDPVRDAVKLAATPATS